MSLSQEIKNDNERIRLHELQTGEATDAQIKKVSDQSATYRELDAKILAAAGPKLGPVKFRMKHNGEVLESGYQQARRAILSGVAELVD
jgi:hypothetical protein